MGTTFSEIITDYAMVQIDDTRLQKLMAENPARFFRKMSMYMLNAVPMFVHPPEAREWLRFTAPVYDDYTYTVTGDEEGSAVVETGVTGFDLVCASYDADDGYGGIMSVSVPVTQSDPETGEVTLAIDGEIPAGTPIDIDIYTDGYFDRELAYDVKMILGLCVQYVWESRFANAFLTQAPKIKDRSFDTGSESNMTRANTERLRSLLDTLNDKMRAFEQRVTYVDEAGYRPRMLPPRQEQSGD